MQLWLVLKRCQRTNCIHEISPITWCIGKYDNNKYSTQASKFQIND